MPLGLIYGYSKKPGSIALTKEPGAQSSGNFVVSLDTSGLTAKSFAVRLGAEETEADIVVAVVRVVVVPVRRTHVLGIVVPAPAADHAVRPRGSTHTIHYYGNSWNAQLADGL